MQEQESIMDKIKSYADAAKAEGFEPMTKEMFDIFPEKQRQFMFGIHKCLTEADALNEGHVKDYDNPSEWKHFPVFDMRTKKGEVPASGFAFLASVYDRVSAYLGARLQFKSEELSDYAAEQFIDDYREWFK